MPDEGTNKVSDDDLGDAKRRFKYLARMRIFGGDGERNI